MTSLGEGQQLRPTKASNKGGRQKAQKLLTSHTVEGCKKLYSNVNVVEIASSAASCTANLIATAYKGKQYHKGKRRLTCSEEIVSASGASVDSRGVVEAPSSVCHNSSAALDDAVVGHLLSQ